MPVIPIAALDGQYISLVKLITFAVLVFAWIPLLVWVYRDAQAVKTKVVGWTSIVFATGAAGAVVWLLVPLFFVGILFYIIAVGATSMAYVIHRNGRVNERERILTVEHIKGIFTDEQKKVRAVSKGLVFITANNNEVPQPDAKSLEFFG